MKQYKLVKVGDHYVALSRGNAKPERLLEQLLELAFQSKEKICISSFSEQSKALREDFIPYRLTPQKFDDHGCGSGGVMPPSRIGRTHEKINI